jgi:hypothetical protein
MLGVAFSSVYPAYPNIVHRKEGLPCEALFLLPPANYRGGWDGALRTPPSGGPPRGKSRRPLPGHTTAPFAQDF